MAISEDKLKQIEHFANQQGITTEQFLIDKIDQWLTESDEDEEFSSIANYIVNKNKELYKRLS